MKKSISMIGCSVVLFVLAGCASLEERSQELRLGMTKESAVKVLGSGYSVAAARVEGDGSAVSVIKYSESKKPDFFLYFRDNKLAQWGDTEVLKAMPPASVKEVQK
jgi:hypothetical protein